MPDLYATIADQPDAVQEQIATVLEGRAADQQQQGMLTAYLSGIEFPENARVLEVGCGTGPISRVLAGWPGVGHVVGVDPSHILITRAKELAGDTDGLEFRVADGRALELEDGSFDVVVFHTVLCHIPGCEEALREGFRVLTPGGTVAVFDGDYATTTLATGEHDPLQACADSAIANLVHDRWLVRRLPALVAEIGFVEARFRSHGFAEIRDPGYMASIVGRGADFLAAGGMISTELAGALKAEAERRNRENRFFGHIAYASVTATRPA